MSNRTAIPSETLTTILVESARRCCLCFGLDGDFSQKRGQVAHIDQNRANHSENNLVYLCLEHHDKYDSSNSQSKGYTKDEIQFYKKKLLEGVRAKLPAQASAKRNDVSGELEAAARFLSSVSPNQPFRSSMLNGHEIQRACEDKLLRIEPFDMASVYISGYRLSCGDEWLMEGQSRRFSGNESFALPPAATAVLSTLEIISLPLWLVGKLVPHQASMLRMGLHTDAPSTIEPGFQGRLFVVAENRSARPVSLMPRMPLVTLELFLLNVHPRARREARYDPNLAYES